MSSQKRRHNAVTTTTISLLSMDVKTLKLISISREILEEALKILNVGAKILAKKVDCFVEHPAGIERGSKAVGGEYPHHQIGEAGVTVNRIHLQWAPMDITEDHLGVFFTKYGLVGDVTRSNTCSRSDTDPQKFSQHP